MEKKNYIDYIVEETKKILAIDSPSGYTKEVAEYVLGEYRALGYEPKLTVKGGVLVALGGKNKEDAVMLEAHIDTLGAIVTEIKSNGRLKVSPIGGMNANNAEAENCRVATRFSGTFEGTCQLSNASVHVNGDYSDTKRSWDEMEIVLDEKADSREETEKLGRYLEKIQICGKELLSMLGNVLDLARIENNKVEMEYTVSNVHECFENCIIMFQQQAESKNQTLSLTEQIMYPYVYMDAPHLSEVCLNIISNAIKYTNTGGTISCNVVQKSCEKEDWCNMIITITDNGIGMSEEFQKRIFETFERERNTTLSHIDGSGIGMGITKKLVELMDGTI